MHELPGMIEECVALATHIEAQGYTVFLPLLFGEPDIEFSRARTALYTVQICVRREILAFAEEKSGTAALLSIHGGQDLAPGTVRAAEERVLACVRRIQPAGQGTRPLTVDFGDTPGHPTHAARDRIVRFFRERLRA